MDLSLLNLLYGVLGFWGFGVLGFFTGGGETLGCDLQGVEPVPVRDLYTLEASLHSGPLSSGCQGLFSMSWAGATHL